MMGDNRDNSNDSRVGAFGTIPLDHLIGRAAMIYSSVPPASGKKPSAVRSGRVGQSIH
jgi:hypothetical protein